eukprot:3941259-Rhodomonas_salina.3
MTAQCSRSVSHCSLAFSLELKCSDLLQNAVSRNCFACTSSHIGGSRMTKRNAVQHRILLSQRPRRQEGFQGGSIAALCIGHATPGSDIKYATTRQDSGSRQTPLSAYARQCPIPDADAAFDILNHDAGRIQKAKSNGQRSSAGSLYNMVASGLLPLFLLLRTSSSFSVPSSFFSSSSSPCPSPHPLM